MSHGDVDGFDIQFGLFAIMTALSGSLTSSYDPGEAQNRSRGVFCGYFEPGITPIGWILMENRSGVQIACSSIATAPHGDWMVHHTPFSELELLLCVWEDEFQAIVVLEWLKSP